MSISKEIKKHFLCDEHKTNERANICVHIEHSLSNPDLQCTIIPLFLERLLINRYNEKYWLCKTCAKNSGISPNGELRYDPALRAIEADDEVHSDEIDETLIVELPKNLEGLIVSVCRECFIARYRDEVERIESSIGSLNEVSIR